MPKRKLTRIVYSGYGDTVTTECRKLLSEEAHNHDCLELEYVTSGEGEMVLRGKCFPLKRGCIFMVRPTDRHSYRFFGEKGIVYRIILPASCVPDSLRRAFIRNKKRGVAYAGDRVCLYLDSMFEMLMSCPTEAPGEDVLYARESFINIIVMTYLKLYNQAGGGLSPVEEELRGVDDAKYYIWENYQNKITLDEVAKAASMHPRYISHIFKKHLGVPIFTFIKLHRLDQAALRLRGTEESVTSICSLVGYTNYANFMRDFKEHFKQTPLEYRQQNKGLDLTEDFKEEMDRRDFIPPSENNND